MDSVKKTLNPGYCLKDSHVNLMGTKLTRVLRIQKYLGRSTLFPKPQTKSADRGSSIETSNITSSNRWQWCSESIFFFKFYSDI